jgi:16S rRNA G966 N2-methylase RsmD
MSNTNSHTLSSLSQHGRIAYLLGGDSFCYPTDEYLDFITPADMFNIVISNANIHLGGLSDKVVWDMFAGIGTDSIRLARHSGKVIATELNTDTFQCLKKNVYSSGLTNIQALNRDCCRDSISISTSPDIIYFDPPWGDTFQSGKPFSFNDVTLNNGWNVINLLKEVKARHADAYLIIKAPYLCDVETYIAEERILSILTFSRQKLKYILVKKEI